MYEVRRSEKLVLVRRGDIAGRSLRLYSVMRGRSVCEPRRVKL